MTLGLQLNSFMMKYLEIRCIIHEEYQEEYLNIKDKNLRENFAGF